jgi:hypothetical protein
VLHIKDGLNNVFHLATMRHVTILLLLLGILALHAHAHSTCSRPGPRGPRGTPGPCPTFTSVPAGQVCPSGGVNITCQGDVSTICNSGTGGTIQPLTHILYVDPNGPFSGADGSIANPYRSIADALAAAPTLTPPSRSPVVLRLSPHAWNEDVQLVDNVFITGDPGAVVILGSVDWTVNISSTSAAPRAMMLSGVRVVGPFTVTNLATHPPHTPAGTVSLTTYDVVFQGPVSLRSRTDSFGSALSVALYGSTTMLDLFNMTNGELAAYGTVFAQPGVATIIFSNGVDADLQGCTFAGGWTIQNSFALASGCNVEATVQVLDHGLVNAIGSMFFQTVFVDATSEMIALESTLPSSVIASSIGGINRSPVVLQFALNTTAGNSGTFVPISPPFIATTDYTVALMEIFLVTTTTTAFSIAQRTASGFVVKHSGATLSANMYATLTVVI